MSRTDVRSSLAEGLFSTGGCFLRTFVRDVALDRAFTWFAAKELVSDDACMMNTPYAPRKIQAATPAREKAGLSDARKLIAEESFDALVYFLVDAGLVSKHCVAVMLDRLSVTLTRRALGLTEAQWEDQAHGLLDRATKLSEIATVMRVERRG